MKINYVPLTRQYDDANINFDCDTMWVYGEVISHNDKEITIFSNGKNYNITVYDSDFRCLLFNYIDKHETCYCNAEYFTTISGKLISTNVYCLDKEFEHFF